MKKVALFIALVAALLGGLWLLQGAALAKSDQGSLLITTRCGPIEFQEAGTGTQLLMVHGSGGGHDQGMAFSDKLTQRGIHVIAMSRFAYLRTPIPADASPAAQADAHVCVLDALGIAQAAVAGGSAGGPSALQMAIRHPNRVSALVLLVPLAYKPLALAPVRSTPQARSKVQSSLVLSMAVMSGLSMTMRCWQRLRSCSSYRPSCEDEAVAK